MERLDVSDGFKLFVSRLNCYTHTPNPNDVGIHVGTQGEVRGRILDLGFGWDNSTGPYTNKGKDLDHSYYSEYVFMHKVVKCIVDGKYTIINDRPYSQKGLISLINKLTSSRSRKLNKTQYIVSFDKKDHVELVIMNITNSAVIQYECNGIRVIPAPIPNLSEWIYDCLDVLGGD